MEPTKAHVEKVDDAASESDDVQQTQQVAIGGHDVDDMATSYWRSPKFIGSCIATILAGNNLYFGYAIPVNILNVINADIGPDPNIYLVSLCNTLIKGIALLIVGTTSDAVGRRWFMIGGQVLAVVGSIMSALAPNVNTLVGGSVFIGLAASTQVLFPLLAQEIVPNKYRGYAQGTALLLVIPAIGFGPIIGRSMVASFGPSTGWRAVFWMNGAVALIALILFVFCYFPPSFKELQGGKSITHELKQIDYGGLFLYSTGLVCLLLALSWGDRQYPWSSPTVIALLVVGIVVLIAFVLYENYMKLSQPLLPMSLFKIRNFWVAVVVGSIGQMAYYAMNILCKPVHITNLYTQDNIEIGWMSCITGMALVLGEVIFGLFFKILGNVRWQMFSAACMLTLFGGLLALGNENRMGLAIGSGVCLGLSVGWIELVAILVAGLVVPPHQIGAAQAFFASCRAVASTIASSIYLAIYNSRLNSTMPAQVSSRALGAGLPEASLPQLMRALTNNTAAALAAVEGANPTIIEAARTGQKRAWAMSFQTVYLSTIAFGGTAILTSLLASSIKKYMTGFVNKTVDTRDPRTRPRWKRRCSWIRRGFVIESAGLAAILDGGGK